MLDPRPRYYTQAVADSLERESVSEALWPILRTWTQAVRTLPEKGKLRSQWDDALTILGLAKDDFDDRLVALDAFLDTLEENYESWAVAHGA